MPRRGDPVPPRKTSPRRPATTPEGRENQLISLAHDLVEQRLRDGTATSQETVHFLKLGSSRERLEQERLRHENELTEAKIEGMKAAVRMEELYANAIKSMSMYQGNPVQEVEDEYEA